MTLLFRSFLHCWAAKAQTVNTMPLLAERIKYVHSIGDSSMDRQRLLKRFGV